MRVKAREQEAESRKFIYGLIDDTSRIKPVKWWQIIMHLPPLLCRSKIAQNLAHDHREQAIGDSTSQRWKYSIGRARICIITLGDSGGLSSPQECRPKARSGRTGGHRASFVQVACPGHDIAGDAKQVDRRQAEEDTDTCVKGNGGRLPQEFCQRCNREVRIIIIVDGIAREPHVVGWKMGATHDCCKNALIHKHFKGANIRPVRANPAKQKYHAKKDRFADHDIGEVGTYQICESAAYAYKANDAESQLW